MALVNARLRKALKRGAPPVMLAEIDHPDGMVRVWSGVGTLDHGGYDWTGLGVLGKVEPIESSIDLNIRDFRLTLRGIPQQATEFLSANVRNRTANVWLSALDKHMRVIEPKLLVANGVMDYQTLDVSEAGQVTISISVISGIWQLASAIDQAWSTEEQIKQYPGDTGFDDIPGLVDRQSNWRLSA